MNDDNPDELAKLSKETQELRDQLAAKDAEIQELKKKLAECSAKSFPEPITKPTQLPPLQKKAQLTNAELERYSRQIILPEFRVKSQVRRRNSSVLVVGAGGLGCPAAVYLAAAGVGRLGVVDYDTVEISNLHRQILHTEARVGVSKSVSIATSLSQVNSGVQVIPYHLALDSSNALEIIKQFHVVLDCTDNVATRYLLNDACVLANKPLVSGSALRWEGQLTVYNHSEGPTYRCLYPQPPPPSAVTNCSDGGVLGVVPGVIGCLQALEAVKILCDMPLSYSGKLLLFDAMEGRSRIVNLRPRQPEADLVDKLVDYEEFCGAAATDKDTGVEVLTGEDRVGAKDLEDAMKTDHVLIDVRTGPEMEMASISGSVNIPMDVIQSPVHEERIKEIVNKEGMPPVFVICRRGNDSQNAVILLRKILPELNIRDVRGGLHAWAKAVDKSFPVY